MIRLNIYKKKYNIDFKQMYQKTTILKCENLEIHHDSPYTQVSSNPYKRALDVVGAGICNCDECNQNGVI